MSINFAGIIKKLGGVDYIEKTKEIFVKNNIEFVNNIMGKIPDAEIINFTKKYGFSMFNNSVCVKADEKNDFLDDGEIELGIIYGFGENENSIKDVIKTYYKEEQLYKKFYPLFEGYPGDIIFYSLEKETFGNIYYWHHESEIGNDIILIKNSFMDFFDGLYFVEDNVNEETTEPKIVGMNLSNDLLKSLKEYKDKNK